MATTEDYQQHEIKDFSCAEENNIPSRENTPLLGNERQRASMRMRPKFHCRRQRCCLTSKAAILILLWNLIIVAGLESFLDPSYLGNTDNLIELEDYIFTIQVMSIISYSVLAFLFLFYPLAGCLADIRWGRYKTIVNSLYFIIGGLLVMVAVSSLAVVLPIIPLLESPAYNTTVSDYEESTLIFTSVIVLGAIFGGIPLLLGLAGFSANIIQFGIDQLHDAPREDATLYIHWYVWTSYAGLLPMRMGFNIFGGAFIFFSVFFFLLPLPLLGVTLCVQRYKRHWFLIDSGSKNPYKLVYQVLKFAKDHTNPIRRSAFTYCEDELPSRLDLGKEKYGGPFTTEEVENVKVFLGILCVLLTLGPIMMVDYSMDGILLRFARHLDIDDITIESITSFKVIATNVDSLTSLLITLFIPLYLCLLRPFIHNHIPGMLKRIGLGMIFILLSALCTSIMDAYGHRHANVTECFLTGNYSYSLIIQYSSGDYTTLDINSYSLIIQYSLNAMGYMLFYIATYEFICSQSPHAMKGLVIGTFFSIKGVFQLLGVVITYIPFTRWKTVQDHNFPSCGFVYYLINAIIVLIGIVAYTCVARKYQYRQRDEPDNIYRYAEEYYANARDEPNYDYDVYDNLNVHTIN